MVRAVPNQQRPMMRALLAHRRGGPESLVVEATPVPQIRSSEVLVAVHAAAITFDELRWDETWSHLPTTPSHEWSGEVAALGAKAARTSGLAGGDAVFGMVPFGWNGAAAEYVVVPSDLVAAKPSSLTHVEAAALPLAGLTARQALVDQGHVGPGDDVVVVGAAGGVGAFAVQLARRMGARVTATAFSHDLDFIMRLGAHHVHPADGPERRPLPTGTYNFVLDTVGGVSKASSIALVRPGGIYVALQEPPPADLLAEHGVEGRFFVVTPRRGDLAQLGLDVDQGKLKVTVAATYPLVAGRQAFESGAGPHRVPGKTVLVVRQDTLNGIALEREATPS